MDTAAIIGGRVRGAGGIDRRTHPPIGGGVISGGGSGGGSSPPLLEAAAAVVAEMPSGIGNDRAKGAGDEDELPCCAVDEDELESVGMAGRVPWTRIGATSGGGNGTFGGDRETTGDFLLFVVVLVVSDKRVVMSTDGDDEASLFDEESFTA